MQGAASLHESQPSLRERSFDRDLFREESKSRSDNRSHSANRCDICA